VQPDLRMHCGIILSNRGVLLGLNTVRQLLALADAVEASPLLDSVWVGDALFVNQRLDALTLLGAIARPHALADAKQFLDRYYGANYSRERLAAWLAYGPPHQVLAQLRGYVGSGCNRIALRLATMGDAANQFRRLTEEVLPFVNADPVASAAALGVS
jgi:hypothetical protein